MSTEEFSPYKIKQWIKENPLDAKCQEDLWTWALDHFDVPEEHEEEVWSWVRNLHIEMTK